MIARSEHAFWSGPGGCLDVRVQGKVVTMIRQAVTWVFGKDSARNEAV
jgi:hypothetical protein